MLRYANERVSMKLAIVTDSTCDWTEEEYATHNVTMVPLKIMVGEESFLDQSEISSEEFYDRMAASEKIPSTSQPSPGDFTAIYASLIDEGYDAIISMHIAPVLSGTIESARIAAQNFDIPIIPHDSKGATSALAIQVQKACELRDSDKSLDEIVETLKDYTRHTHLYLSPDNTDNLLKGGRLTEEQAQGAAMLNIKLVFSLDEDGRLYSFDKVKGSKGVTKRFVDIIETYAKEQGRVRVRIMHARNYDAVEALTSALEESSVDCEIAAVDTCGATIATHVGVGVIGFAIAPA